MKSLFFLIYVLIYTLSPLFGGLHEAKNFEEITDYINSETLVIVDIDDTLLIPVQTLGTDVWFLYRLEHHLKTMKDRFLALDKALAEWEAIRHITNVKVVEEGTEKVIEAIQKSHVRLIGLTTQGLALATRTVMQLKSLSIDLSKTSPTLEDHYFINGSEGVLFRSGILFTSGTSKGEALLKLFETIPFFPRSVVFINDKKTHLQDVEKSLLSKNIDFIGLRYSYSDERVANFCKEIADIQWIHSTFDHILSDEEASLILKKSLN